MTSHEGLNKMDSNRFRLKGQRVITSESDVAKAVVDLLRYRGYYVIRLQVGTFQAPGGKGWVKIGEPGLPDYVAIHAKHPGFFIETKRTGAKPSEAQLSKHIELTRFYRLPVVTVDNVQTLVNWLGTHEGKTDASL